jgi:hypothetical protein
MSIISRACSQSSGAAIAIRLSSSWYMIKDERTRSESAYLRPLRDERMGMLTYHPYLVNPFSIP